MIHEVKETKQQEAYQTWIARGHRGLIAACTGSGKSRIGTWAARDQAENPDLTLISARGEEIRRTLLVVPTIPLRDKDWPMEFQNWNLGHLLEKSVRIICYDSLFKENLNDYGLIVFDESHHLTLNMFQAANMTIAIATGIRILMLSATPPDQHGEWEKYQMMNLMGGCIFTLPLEEGIDLGIVSDYKMRVYIVPLDDKDRYIEVGPKHKRWMSTEAKQYEYMSKLLLEQRMIQNPSHLNTDGEPHTPEEIEKAAKLEIMYLRQIGQFLKNVKSKNEVARRLIERRLSMGQRVIGFFGSIAKCDELFKDFAYHSESDKKKGVITALDRFRNMESNLLVSVDSLNEGINVVADSSVAAHIDGKSRRLIQRLGRIVRWREGHIAEIDICLCAGTEDEKSFESASRELDQDKITVFRLKPSA